MYGENLMAPVKYPPIAINCIAPKVTQFTSGFALMNGKLLYFAAGQILDTMQGPMAKICSVISSAHRTNSPIQNRLILSKTQYCLQGKELFLIRNWTRGRGVSFFDHCGHYPDFIFWSKDDNRQHAIFLDPKGLGCYGPEKRKKVELRTGIKDIEKRIHRRDPSLHLHAYILSITPPEKISEQREQKEWEQGGVYFLQSSDRLERVIPHALASAS